MARVPLTTAGVLQKQEELFALAQPELDAQAASLTTDFRLWVSDNFELTPQEQGFLDSADDNFIRLLSSVVFVSVRNRLPIDFVKSTVVTAVKRFDTTSSFDFSYQWGGALTSDTDVKLEIVYT
ncbi:hypothetical protein NU10_02820 [Flavobacterium dauae]|uniref:hypothetical protein n=1 Tax=Flavobacterium dauae TaxID=1563479 RepID=UPI00101B9D09|nr:hypothetical protein [Flavobacterium dauae]WLD24354.1 hypothetical protein NU10_02820 [Flavobacterium dauae]